jgi:hypothetical protein
MWRGASDAELLRKDRRRVVGRSARAWARGLRCWNAQAHVCGGAAAWQLGADGSRRRGSNAGKSRPSRRQRWLIWRGESEGEATQRHEAVGAGVTRRGFDAQRKTDSGGRPALMVSQQVERGTVLQNPEVRAELNRRVRECEQKCFASGQLGSIPQVCARARQQATREQVEGQWCESRTGTAQEMRPGVAILQEATRVCRPCF